MASQPPVAAGAAPPTQQILVPSALQVALTSWVSKGLIALGGVAASHGLTTMGHVQSAAGPDAEVIVGTVIALASAWWANRQAKKHTDWLDELAKVVPNEVALSRSQQAAQKAAS